VRPEATVAEVRELMARAHTRYPVVDETDQPLGVVQLADVLATGLPDGAPVTDLMRPAVVLPTTMTLPDALGQLNSTRNQLACVIDEYGGFTGVLTVEDLAEELVGEITDEHDPEQPVTVTAEDDGVWVMGGDVHVDEAERALGHDLPRGDHETVSGLLIAQHGALPRAGDTIEVPLPDDPADLVHDEPVHRTIVVDVLSVERHVPRLVRVRLVEQRGDAPAADDAPPTTHEAARPTDAAEETR